MPRRPYGSQLSDSNPSKEHLAANLPIIGLGCSSFSTFFQNPEVSEDKIAETKNEEDDNVSDLSWVIQENSQVQEWVETIMYAVKECGINLLDTAPWYGHGSSEIVIGYAMEKMLHTDLQQSDGKMKREDIIINTKIGRYESNPKSMFDFSGKRVLESVELSIKRMKCQYIDVLQLHDPEFAPSIDLLLEETIPQMVQMQKMGLVKAIGITGYPLSVQKQIIERSWNELGIKIDQSLTYGHFNLHDQSLFSPYSFSTSSQYKENICSEIPFANYIQKDRNMGLMCAAPLSMGLLTHNGSPLWHPASSSLKLACQEASHFCERHGINISKLAIAFALSNRRVSCTLLGIKNIKEVDMAMEAALLFSDENDHIDKSDDAQLFAQLGMLEKKLTPIEFKSMKHILNRTEGPFHEVSKNGQFEWDGVQEANMFWDQFEGGQKEGERIMREK